MRDSALIYRSFYEAIKEIPKENQAEIWEAICEYSFNFNDINLTGLSKTIFCLIKPQLIANIKKFNNGKIPKKAKEKQKRSKGKAKGSKTQANDNVKDNVNDNKLSTKVDWVIDQLNKYTGKNYQKTAKATRKIIEERINEGRTGEDFKKVLEIKSKQWVGTEHEKYLRPETLFNVTKFESYVNENPVEITSVGMDTLKMGVTAN